MFDPSIYPTTAHMVQLTGDEDVIYTGTIPTQFGACHAHRAYPRDDAHVDGGIEF